MLNQIKDRAAGFRRAKAWLARILAALSMLGLSSPAQADVWTLSRQIGYMQVVTAASGVATYYFSDATGTGWGAAGCTTAVWAYIYNDRVGAQELLALAMQAKQTGKNVRFVGNCVSGFFNITAVEVAS